MVKKRHFLSFSLIMVMILALTGCSVDTSYPGEVNIIEAKDAISRALNNDNILIIDARSADDFARGHMEGAIHLPPTLLVSNDPVPMSLPTQDQLERVMGEKGITEDMTLFIYDNNSGVASGRLWWTLKVFGHDNVMMINGGEIALVKAGAPLTTQAIEREARVYNAKPLNRDLVITFDELKPLVDDLPAHVKIIDVRSTAEFQAGFIPGAIFYPHTRNLYKNNYFVSSRDMRLLLQDQGVSPSDTIILYCKTSFRATPTAALLMEAGFENVLIYDGAWDEWETKVDVTQPSAPGEIQESGGC